MKLEKLTISELMMMEQQINQELQTRNLNFWKVIDELNILEIQAKKFKEKENKLKNLCEEIRELEKLDFSVVRYDSKNVGFLNFQKPKIDDEFYAVIFEKESQQLLNNKKNPVSDKEINQMKSIFNLGDTK